MFIFCWFLLGWILPFSAAEHELNVIFWYLRFWDSTRVDGGRDWWAHWISTLEVVCELLAMTALKQSVSAIASSKEPVEPTVESFRQLGKKGRNPETFQRGKALAAGLEPCWRWLVNQHKAIPTSLERVSPKFGKLRCSQFNRWHHP